MQKEISKIKKSSRLARKRKIRSMISGTAERPRLSIFKSNQHIYVQLIDDVVGKTLAAASDFEIKNNGSFSEISKEVGALIAKKAKDAKVAQAVFDRGGYRYHGVVKSLADGAREGGLKF